MLLALPNAVHALLVDHTQCLTQQDGMCSATSGPFRLLVCCWCSKGGWEQGEGGWVGPGCGKPRPLHLLHFKFVLLHSASRQSCTSVEHAKSSICLQAKGLSAEYYLYKDEGHGFARPPNKFDFYSRVEQFLSKHLGGRAEPLMQVEGSSVVVMHES